MTIANTVSTTPQDIPAAGAWQASTPQTAASFTAVGFYFGREILAQVKVPVGLIRCAYSGTSAEAWTSREALLPLGDFTADLPAVDGTVVADPKRFGPKGENRPSVLFNGMIHPLQPFALKGVLWYQGETNGWPHLAAQYARLLPALIGDWRARFGDPGLPFGIVQLAGFGEPAKGPTDSGWTGIRDAQSLTAREVPSCGLALAIDIGEKGFHPKKKAEIGHRLALWARATVYGEKDLEWSGPWFRSMRVADGAARISFDHIQGGLRSADGGPITGFAISGADKKWRFAETSVEGNEVVLRSKDVPVPVAVRYAWAMQPVCNLVNGAGLPAVPFRTDDWKWF